MLQNSEKIVFEARELEYKTGHKIIFQALNFQIKEGETFVITGASGSGKTTLAKILCGEINHVGDGLYMAENMNAVLVAQQDHFSSDAGLRISYYSQRYETINLENAPTVTEYLSRKDSRFQNNKLQEVFQELEIAALSDRKILSLSNGERKRVQLAEALLQEPDVLALDQPFIGLDAHSGEILTAILKKLKRKGTTIILVSDSGSIPSFSDSVLELSTENNHRLIAFSDYHSSDKNENSILNSFQPELFNGLHAEEQRCKSVLKMKNVNVSFGGKPVLNNIDWEVKPGERWVLRGHNGAGKTTLLSLITADNPQAYSNDLELFDQKRGSGESIWDIKKRIGFVSPELHLYFLRQRGLYHAAKSTQVSYNSLKCIDVVLSGLKDEVGFTTSHLKTDAELARKWLHALGMDHLETSAFLHSSLGEQRIILLARALIKSPALLILDEPCQGLDRSQTIRFTDVLDQIFTQSKTTMIYVTHRPEEIPASVTHLLELENGRVRQCGLLAVNE